MNKVLGTKPSKIEGDKVYINYFNNTVNIYAYK